MQVFGTNSDSKIGCFTHTFQVTLLKRSDLKTLQSKINIVKNTFACFREKSQIVSLSTFDKREFNKINYFNKNVSRVQERAFFTLLWCFCLFLGFSSNLSDTFRI